MAKTSKIKYNGVYYDLPKGEDGKPGKDGRNGRDGRDGSDPRANDTYILEEDNVDLSITDERGYAIAKFGNGHIETKKFNSADIPLAKPLEAVDFSISDEEGYAIAEFRRGHIKTKNFDSSSLPTQGETYAEFSITDEKGNSIVDFLSGHIKTKHFDSSKLKNELKILSIGNSYSYDAFSYVPKLLEEALNMDITFGILYRAGCTLQTHWEDYIDPDEPYVNENNISANFGRYTTKNRAWELNPIVSNISNVMASESWDIIILQQSYTVSTDYSTYQPYLNNIIDKVISLAIKPIKFGFLLTPSLPQGISSRTETTSDNDFLANASNMQSVLEDSLVDFILPCGTAIQNARHTSLDSIPTVNGVSGHMNYVDSNGVIDAHLNEGLPCLIEAYAATLKILEVIGYSHKGILGSQIRPDDVWLTEINVIGKQGSSEGVTNTNCILAQKCAVKAVKSPYEISNI